MNMEHFSTEALNSMEQFSHVPAFVLGVSFLTTLPLHATRCRPAAAWLKPAVTPPASHHEYVL